MSYKKIQKGNSMSSEIKINEEKKYFTEEVEILKKEPTINLGAEELNKWDECSRKKQKESRPYGREN